MSIQLYLNVKNKRDDFEKKSKAKIFQGSCFYISLIISYIFYVIYLDKYQNNIYEDVYIILSCWMSATMEKPFWIINCILLFAICFIHLHTYKYISKQSSEYIESIQEKEHSSVVSSSIKMLNKIKRKYLIYPFSILLLYLIIGVGRYLREIAYFFKKEHVPLMSVLKISKIIYSAGTNLRGFVFTVLCLITQEQFKSEFYMNLLCKKCCVQKNEPVAEMLNDSMSVDIDLTY
jgi:hypothetical protein